MLKDQKDKLIIILTYSIVTFLFVGVFTFSKSCKAQSNWVSMDERKKIWDDIAGENNYQISYNGLKAGPETELGTPNSSVDPTMIGKYQDPGFMGCPPGKRVFFTVFSG
jgi:hypothetical protein